MKLTVGSSSTLEEVRELGEQMQEKLFRVGEEIATTSNRLSRGSTEFDMAEVAYDRLMEAYRKISDVAELTVKVEER